MNRTQLQSMTALRVADSDLLLKASSWSAAYYLIGYAVELSLKVCISKQFSVDTIPDKGLVNKIFTHDYDTLIGLAGLRVPLKERLRSDQDFAASWGICNEWTPEARYDSWYEIDARALYVSVTHPTFGVLPWIKTYW
jgi:hypothetical protein